MEKFVYYWSIPDVYCYKPEIKKFTEQYGQNYSSHKAGEFFATIWIGKEKL